MGGPFTRFTTRLEGDFRVDTDQDELRRRRAEVRRGAWTWLRQVHGSRVVTVDAPGAHAGVEADAAVSAHPDAVLAVHTADCVPVVFSDAAGTVVGAAHAGWRGLVAGVIPSTVDAMVALGATGVVATVGPHIRGRCYEFGAADLDVVADAFGDRVRTSTGWGTPALDMTEAVVTALRRVDEVVDVSVMPGCTACEPARFFSHRARRDTGRHAAVVQAVAS